MSSSRNLWKIGIGCIVTLIAIAAFVTTWLSQDKPEKTQDTASPEVATPTRARRESSAATVVSGPHDLEDEAILVEPEPAVLPEDAEAGGGNPTELKLRELLAAGPLNAVRAELESLAKNHQLGSAAEVLEEWCRKESVELVQWCLVFSHENDPSLNIALCAEALAHPSEVIRELATSQLEERSGIRFTQSRQARSWVESQQPR